MKGIAIALFSLALFSGTVGTVALADSYGYGAYGGVNNVVMPQMYRAATADKAPEPSLEQVKLAAEQPLIFRTFLSGLNQVFIQKFVDPDNGNVCYIIRTRGGAGISCIKG